MSNILLQKDAYCIINKEGNFVFVNEIFLRLFHVSEQECFNGLKIQDFIVNSELFKIYSYFPLKELIVKNTQGNYFPAFVSSDLIPETGLFAINIKILSEKIITKRIVTSFLRYIERQVAIACLKYENENFFPLITYNTDIIDDNPSFMINLGNELTISIKNTIRSIKNFSGLIKTQKLENYQNYYAVPYIFQLLVPGTINESEINTETFLLVFIFPHPLTNIFQNEEKLKMTLQEHLSQLNSPADLTLQFLEEIKQKAVLHFNSQFIQVKTSVDQKVHNLEVHTLNLLNLSYADAIQKFGNFCADNFEVNFFNIYQTSSKENKMIYSLTSEDFSENKHHIEEVRTEFYSQNYDNKIITLHNFVYYPYYDKKSNLISGFLQLRFKSDFLDKEVIKIADEFSKLIHFVFQGNFVILQKLAQKMLHESTVANIFNTITYFVMQIFEYKLFAALIYDSETESLQFQSQSGYHPNFNMKSIGLNSKNSVVAKCGRDKKIYNIEDVRKCSFYLAGDPSVLSELAVPLIYNNQLIGVLNVESPMLNAFSPNYHVPILQLICDIATTNYVRLSTIKKVGTMNLI